MENNSKTVIANVREKSGNLEGELIRHTNELVPDHASYSIELIPRLVKKGNADLKEGEIIHDSFGKEWEITKVL